MKILVVDAQGGGYGKALVLAIKQNIAKAEVMAVGTNDTATAAMKKAGADHVATGENPVVVACRDADIIVGPIGIVIADSLYGEITPKIAAAIGQSRAKKILVPVNHCDNIVVGIKDFNMSQLIREAVEEIRKYLSTEKES